MDRIAKAIASRWWLLVLDGLLAVLFGLSAWAWPGLTVATLVALYAAFAIVGGAMNLVAAFAARRDGESPWGSVFRGVLGIGAGLGVAVWPGISALALLDVIAAYAVVGGVYEVAAAVALRRLIDNEWLLALAGIASIAFGVLVGIFPGGGAVALVWTIGVYAVAFGALLIALGVRLRGWGRRLAPATAEGAP